MLEEPHEVLFEDFTSHNNVLKGLARECPNCHIIDHYEVKGRNPVEVRCKCGHYFTVQKYKRSERPKAKRLMEIPQITLIQGKCLKCKKSGLIIENNSLCIKCAGKLVVLRFKGE